MSSKRLCFRTTELQEELIATIADELGCTNSAAVEWLCRISLDWMLLWDERLGAKLGQTAARMRVADSMIWARDLARAAVDKGLYDPRNDGVPY